MLGATCSIRPSAPTTSHVTQYGSGFISGDDGGVGQCEWFDYRIMRQHHRRHSFMQLVELVSTVSQFCRLMVYAARPIA